eukprot:891375-Alexandrium_andersonii.AAC.1
MVPPPTLHRGGARKPGSPRSPVKNDRGKGCRKIGLAVAGRDRSWGPGASPSAGPRGGAGACLLYTSDAADDM